jgi:hypothetical protein
MSHMAESYASIETAKRTNTAQGSQWGNLINYPGNCGTPTADLFTVKLLLNSIISMPNAKFMSIDIKDFYLNTPMAHYKYFRMKLELFPKDVIIEFNLCNKVNSKGNVHCEV